MSSNKRKIFTVTILLAVCGCGLGINSQECGNAHPAQDELCEAVDEQERTTWDSMKWDEGTWKE